MASAKKRGRSTSKNTPKYIFPSFILIFALILISLLYVLVPPLFGKVTEGVNYRGPIAHYNFESRSALGDDVAGTYDASCDARLGQTCPGYITLNKNEGAADFSGRENRQLVIGTPISLPGEFTILFAVHQSSGGTIVWGTNGGIIVDSNNGRIQFSLLGSGLAASDPAPGGQWVHYAIVRNNNDIVRFYKNGVLESGTYEVEGSFNIETIGFSTPQGNLQGFLDNLKIFDYALVEWQIRVSGRFPAVENTATLCRDTIDNDNDGQTDCADENCNSLVVGSDGERCEFGEEQNCHDNFDNDGDNNRDGQDDDCQYLRCSATDDTLIWVWSYLPTENPAARPARVGCCQAYQCQSERAGCVNDGANPNPTTICGVANNWDTCGSGTDPYPDSSPRTATIKHTGELSDWEVGYCDGSQWNICTEAAEGTQQGDFICNRGIWVNRASTMELCEDGMDNDLDGLVDEGCAASPAEICGDRADNNENLFIDEGCTEQCAANSLPSCSEAQCAPAGGVWYAPDSEETEEEPFSICVECSNNGDCTETEMCRDYVCVLTGEAAAEICGDSVDNDNDGQIDENCAAPSQPSSGGQPTAGSTDSGTSSGGGGTRPTERTGRQTCLSDWKCGLWTACNSTSQRSRTCTDANQCTPAQRTKREVKACTFCTESWVCQEWSACQDGRQNRICADENTCGSTVEKPATEQECAMQPEIKKPEPNQPDLQKPSPVGKYIAWGSGIAVSIATITALILARKRKKITTKKSSRNQ